MNNFSDGERLAILETKVDDIKKDILEIKELVKAIDGKYAIRKEVDTRIDGIEKRMDSNASWIRGVVIASVGTIIYLLIKFIFKV